MLILLSPAKSLDFETRLPRIGRSQPRLLSRAGQLADLMRTKTVADLARLQGISAELAALNAQRWADFTTQPEPDARQAVLAFDGEVYHGLDARNSFTTRDFTEAQKTLRILSGLYGVLRPLDAIQPYRLEMGTRLANEAGRSLYHWWGEAITELLREDLGNSPGSPVVVNLASAEYFDSVDPLRLGAPVVSPRFEDTDARSRRSVVPFYAKRARGAMAGWLVRNRVRRASVIHQFAENGYRYDPAASTAEVPVFVRAFADR